MLLAMDAYTIGTLLLVLVYHLGVHDCVTKAVASEYCFCTPVLVFQLAEQAIVVHVHVVVLDS